MAGRKSIGPLTILTTLYALSLWVVTSALDHEGLGLLFVGLAFWAWALLRLRREKPGAAFAGVLGTCIIAASVASIELLLRMKPGLARGEAGNACFAAYNRSTHGIFLRDMEMGHRMKPGQRRAIYGNGYWWTHEANASGYRGQELDRADVVFLGDSMVYGHGVETNQTVPARFEQRTGLKSANLGLSMSSPIQAWMRYEELGTRLRPRWVFLCLHPNDHDDVNGFYETAELERWLDAKATARPLARQKYWPRPWWDLEDRWTTTWRIPLHIQGGLHLAKKRTLARLRKQLAGNAAPAAERLHSPSSDLAAALATQSRMIDSGDLDLEWRANRRAIERIRDEVQAKGGTLVLFDLGHPPTFSMFVERLALALGVPYSAAGREVACRAAEGEAMFLEGDGHWTPAGCDAVAERLARHPILTLEARRLTENRRAR